MTSVLVNGIRELVTNDVRHGPGLGILHDAAVVVESGALWVGNAMIGQIAETIEEPCARQTRLVMGL